MDKVEAAEDCTPRHESAERRGGGLLVHQAASAGQARIFQTESTTPVLGSPVHRVKWPMVDMGGASRPHVTSKRGTPHYERLGDARIFLHQRRPPY